MDHIVSFSGGKDSTAMLIRMIELDYKIDRIIFADTGFEFEELYQYIDIIEKYIGRKIERLKTEQCFDKWFYGKLTRGKRKGEMRGFPLVKDPCYWSRESKFKVLDKVCRGNIRYIGIASDEPKRIHKNDGYIYPLVDWDWTEQKCSTYLMLKRLVNPLYKRFSRLGCWWCPKQSIKSLKSLFIYYPTYWEKLKILERESPVGYKPNIKLVDLEKRFLRELRQLTIFDLIS